LTDGYDSVDIEVTKTTSKKINWVLVDKNLDEKEFLKSVRNIGNVFYYNNIVKK
jgi:hypothetical protein